MTDDPTATAAVWVLSANAPDNQSVVGVYASPEAAQREHPGEWQQVSDDWEVKRPVADSVYGGVLERFDVIA